MQSRHIRAILSLACVALAALAAAVAGNSAGPAGSPGSVAGATPAATQLDGMLTLRAANGVLTLSGRGSMLAQVVGKARVLIDDPDPSDGVPVVSGYDRLQRQSRTSVLYTGSDLRFRVLGGQFRAKVVASGISLSFVGRGIATLLAAGTLDDGVYSLDGGDTYRPVGFGLTTIVVGAAAGAAAGSSLSGLALDRP